MMSNLDEEYPSPATIAASELKRKEVRYQRLLREASTALTDGVDLKRWENKTALVEALNRGAKGEP
ncbi:MAG: hypothetical protein EOM24_29950 [Chloroflexia bacterium]|nr:hypothetical protein [Chloroflexia bacterium]